MNLTPDLWPTFRWGEGKAYSKSFPPSFVVIKRERWGKVFVPVLRVPEAAVLLDHVEVGVVVNPAAGLSVVVAS